MQNSLKTMLISVAALLSVAATVPALAGDAGAPVVTLVLPGGATEPDWASGVGPSLLRFNPATDIGPAFAAIQRIEAALDRQADLMLQRSAEWPALTPAMLERLPAGTSSYTLVSTFSSNGACTRSTQISYTPGQAAPRTVSSTSGNCGPVPDRTIPARDITPDGQRIVPAAWER